jgi:hypothetical protein
MNQILDENGQMLNENKNDVGLYRVEFMLQNEARTIDLLLTVKKTNKTRELIATLLKRKSTQIRKVNHIFIKRIQGFTSGLEGTKAYLQLLKLQKQERKRIGQQKRLFSRYYVKKFPFKPQSKIIQWTRHLFLGAEELRRNIVKIHHNQTQRYWFPGVDMHELDKIEDHFNVNINIYRFNGKKAVMERHSRKNCDSTLCLIINLSRLTQVFQCPECHSFFSEFKKIKPHLNICKKPKIVFEDGSYQPKLSVFENLELNGISVPRELRFYPYFIYFDFEAWLKPVESTGDSKLKYIGTHELLSISLIGSEESIAEFTPVESTPERALDVMMIRMNEIRKKYLQCLYPKYSKFFGMITALEDEKLRKQLRGQLLEWLDALPVYGFNSTSYDINVIKKYLPQLLMKHNKKHGNVSKSEKLWIRFN